jgi:hypothetical protein
MVAFYSYWKRELVLGKTLRHRNRLSDAARFARAGGHHGRLDKITNFQEADPLKLWLAG